MIAVLHINFGKAYILPHPQAVSHTIIGGGVISGFVTGLQAATVTSTSSTLYTQCLVNNTWKTFGGQPLITHTPSMTTTMSSDMRTLSSVAKSRNLVSKTENLSRKGSGKVKPQPWINRKGRKGLRGG